MYRCPYCSNRNSISENCKCIICDQYINEPDNDEIVHAFQSEKIEKESKKLAFLDINDFILRKKYKRQRTLESYFNLSMAIITILGISFLKLPILSVEYLESGVTKEILMTSYLDDVLMMIVPLIVYSILIFLKKFGTAFGIILAYLNFIPVSLAIYAGTISKEYNVVVYRDVGFYVLVGMILVLVCGSVINIITERKRYFSYNKCPVDKLS